MHILKGHDLNYLSKQPLRSGLKLIHKELEKAEEVKAWQMWIAKYQHMNEDNFMAFSDFYKQISQPLSQRTAEEIVQEAQSIRQALGKH